MPECPLWPMISRSAPTSQSIVRQDLAGVSHTHLTVRNESRFRDS